MKKILFTEHKLNSKLTNLPSATPSDIESAIRSLSKADLNRLSVYARWLIAHSFTSSRREFQAPDELINEAVLRTLLGKRKWVTTQPLTEHLMGVMKSCVFHAANSARARTELLNKKDTAEEGTQEYLSEGPEDAVLAAEADTACAAMLTEISGHFSSDNDATVVLEGWRAGFSGSDIMELNNLTRNNFESAAKRIRRYARSQEKKRV